MAGDKAKIVKALGWDWDDATFRLNVAELIGTLCLMNHWLRGMMRWLTFTGAVKFTPAQQKNWNNLIACLENTEETVWKIVPPRNFLTQIRVLRDDEYELDPEWMKLLEVDDFGRSTFEGSPEIMNRLKAQNNQAADAPTGSRAPNK